MFRSFEPFSALHAIVLIVFIACCAASIAHGRTKRDVAPSDLRRRERQFAWINLCLWIAVQIFTLLPRNFVAGSALPLHVCDLASPIVTVAMLRPDLRIARTMLYYWGIGLCTQAFINPDLKEGPADLRFWAFWLPHAAMVGAAVYDVGVRRFRPGWDDLRIAVVLTLIYFLIVFTIDAIFDCNYGYVGRSRPGRPTAIDAFGPWPARVGVIMAIGALVFVLITLPFRPWRRSIRPAPLGPSAG
jgi:hypothetical integral membrane protein (TIGR02206 family)